MTVVDKTLAVETKRPDGIPTGWKSPRESAKTLARGLARMLALPYYVAYRSGALISAERAFRDVSQALSVLPGLPGDYVRREFYRMTLGECSADCQIVFGTLFASRAARIGARVYIGSHCMIADADIGADVLLGSNVHLLSGRAQHGIDDLDVPIGRQPRRSDMIHIGEDTWIGNGSIVMADIGKKCVVGAGSVVVAPIPDYSIAGGNPARVLKMRGR
jgi:acetyltransferase-like isoleucine patch superfamily enzyme